MSNACRRTLALAFGVALALVLLPSVAEAGHSWGPYHWARTANPFTLKLGDNVNATWDPMLSTASSDWTASSVLNTTIVAGGTAPKSCRPTDGRVEVCNARYGNTGWLGVAQIWITGGEHITQCIVKLNDTYHDNPPYNTVPWRRLVTCQEIGHCFGLDHQDENFNNGNLGTCMDYTNDPDGPPSNEHPNSHDYAQLETIYAHTDSITTVKRLGDDMPPAMRQILFEGPAQWGRLVWVAEGGGAAIYEADFGGGNRVITRVVVATEAVEGNEPDAAERPARQRE
ncbi:MAG TPA: hypothetical protein VF017_20245 [Thermoanaerobaculia bacterium]|nr:hypothetical protein [Thermoanaerobaculia bacterium]